MEKMKSRGDLWLTLLTDGTPLSYKTAPSVKAVHFGGAVYLAVVPDSNNRYPRARHGEVGLIEGWTLAKVIHSIIDQDRLSDEKTPIVAIVDVTSQAYGRREEAFGIHQALAGAVAAYAQARMAGHPVIALIVGKAMSGAFLAHGYQANELIAFDDQAVLIHAMGKESAARITLRSVEDLDCFAATVPPMAYDIKHYATLGLLSALLHIENPDAPNEDDVVLVRTAISGAIEKAKRDGVRLDNRLGSENRSATVEVRNRMKAVWK